MRNMEIRQRLKECNIKHWELADLLGISESTLCVKLRKELPDNDRERILCVINEFSRQRAVK